LKKKVEVQDDKMMHLQGRGSGKGEIIFSSRVGTIKSPSLLEGIIFNTVAVVFIDVGGSSFGLYDYYSTIRKKRKSLSGG